jgi:protocatechuate 3,4-dioxygenase beta subunit
MTPQKNSTSRWTPALAAMVVVPALIALVVEMLHHRGAPRVVAVASASAAVTWRPAPLIPVAARPRASITGRVLGPAGQPVAGATVCAFVRPSSTTTTAETRAPRCVAGGADGVYLLADLPSGTSLTLSASAPTFLPQAYAGEGDGVIGLAEGEPRAGVDFAMRGGGVEVRGRVADATGGVVPGAIVASEAGEATARAIATSDAKGEFSLWVAPGVARLGASATGYAPGRAQGPAPGHFFSIYLVPGATLVGRAVIAGTETPVAAARIDAIQVEGGGPRASTSTESDGHFRVEGLAPGRYRIEATSEGREGYSRSSITLLMGETSPEAIVELDPAFVVQGRVVVKGSGEPCKEGHVRITDPKQNEFSQGSIDAGGAVRMASVIPGKYEVEVECEGHIALESYPDIVVADRDLAPQTWEVESGASVRVSLVDPSGKSIPEARVIATEKEGRRNRGASTERVEPDGTFLVRGLKVGTFSVIAILPDGTSGSQDDVIVDGQREERVKIEIPFAGAIEGVVQDLDRRPVAGISVVASGPRRRAMRSLDDGTFLLSGLPPGEYTVSPQEPGRRHEDDEERQKTPPLKVTVAAPGRARATITLSRRLGAISGTVVDADGQPVTDAFLEYGPAEGGSPRHRGGAPVVTDTEGHFSIEGLIEGEYNLRASRKGAGEGSVEHVKVGTRNVSLRIARGASIAGLLSSPKGPIDRFDLQVRETTIHFSRSEMFFHAGGQFSLRDLPPGVYEVVAETPEGSATTEVTLAEGEQKAGISLVMALRVPVDGRVVSVDGRPLAGLRVRVVGDGSVSPMNGPDAVSRADGRFHLENILGGSWKLEISPDGANPDIGFSTRSIEVSRNGATDLGDVRVEKRPEPAPENHE